MTPAKSWALLVLVGLVTLAAIVLIARLDRALDDALERRRSRRRRIHGFDEEHRYQLAREAVARQLDTSHTRIGHRKDTPK